MTNAAVFLHIHILKQCGVKFGQQYGETDESNMNSRPKRINSNISI